MLIVFIGGLTLLQVALSIQLLKITLNFWHNVKVDKEVLPLVSIPILTIYANAHVRVGWWRVIVAILHAILSALLVITFIYNRIDPKTAVVSRTIILILTSLQMVIVMIDQQVRIEMNQQLMKEEKDARATMAVDGSDVRRDLGN